MPTTKLYTAEDLLRMPFDAWYELIDGELADAPPSAARSSAIAALLGSTIFNFA